jgi:hypothetical protein
MIADSDRWTRFTLRPGDVIITTPAKCGTTWMQHIVGMLLLGRTDLGPITELSPWLDMLTRSEADVFAQLEAQQHRRFIKTHTPLDGLPMDDEVTYLAVIRHPLDVALSDRDHRANIDLARAASLLIEVTGTVPEIPPERLAEPQDPADFLRWFIDNDLQPSGSGPYGLADYCQQVSTYWSERHRPNVHLFHYSDLWSDLRGEMRRAADALGVAVDDERWSELIDAATLDTMRANAAEAAPDAQIGMWSDNTSFFRQGGTRAWAELLDDADIAHFHERLATLAGDASGWILDGLAAIDRGR